MLRRLKQYLAIGLVLVFFYYLLANHFIFFSWNSFETLKKNQLTFRYTFYNVVNKKPEKIMGIDQLREAGIGDLLVERGLVSNERMNQILRKIEME